MFIRISLLILTILLTISVNISSFAISSLTNEQKEFISAIKSNNIPKIKSILALPGFRTAYIDENSDSPMIIAAREGNEETVQLLLNNDPYFSNFQNSKLETVLIAAVKRNDTGIIKKILEAEMSLHGDITMTDINDKSALDYAKSNNNQEIITLLKIAVSELGLNEELMESARDGDVTTTKKLIKQGADVNYSPFDPEGPATPLIVAAGGGSTEVVELLIANGANIEKQGIYAMANAVMNNNINVVKLFLATGIDINQHIDDNFHNTALSIAIAYNHPEMVNFLLANGANPNIQTKWGYPLSQAYELAPPAKMEIIKVLIKAGADVNMYGILIKAVTDKNIELVKLLLEYQANPNIQNEADGDTPLLIAIRNKSDEIAKLLLKYKANPNLQNNKGENPLRVATNMNPKMIKPLISSGAEIE